MTNEIEEKFSFNVIPWLRKIREENYMLEKGKSVEEKIVRRKKMAEQFLNSNVHYEHNYNEMLTAQEKAEKYKIIKKS